MSESNVNFLSLSDKQPRMTKLNNLLKWPKRLTVHGDPSVDQPIDGLTHRCQPSCSDDVDPSAGRPDVYLGWKESSLTMHCFFSGTCFQEAGWARSTRALALRRPKPKRLLTISPAPFLFQPGLLARGSNSEVHTTMCCRSLQVSSGLERRETGHVKF